MSDIVFFEFHMIINILRDNVILMLISLYINLSVLISFFFLSDIKFKYELS